MSNTTASIDQLRRSPHFKEFVECVRQTLEEQRDRYEHTEPASEFLRGTVFATRTFLTLLTSGEKS
jgi:hypothetical protein